jgi:hypothetical protein
MDFSFSIDRSTGEVEVPQRWVVRSRNTFAELYGMKRNLEVVEYEVPAADGGGR